MNETFRHQVLGRDVEITIDEGKEVRARTLLPGGSVLHAQSANFRGALLLITLAIGDHDAQTPLKKTG